MALIVCNPGAANSREHDDGRDKSHLKGYHIDRVGPGHHHDEKHGSKDRLEQLFRNRVALAVNPQQKIVSFRQLVFDFESGRLGESDWGRLSVDRRRLAMRFGAHPAYINVFFPAAHRLGRTLWSVRNLYIPGAPDDWRGQSGQVSQELDLRPDEDNGSGIVARLDAIVLVSRQPLPFVAAGVDFAQQISGPGTFEVTPQVENA